MTHEMTEQLKIRQLVENWAVWRDAGLWDRFRTVWHDDGVMMATWFQGPYEEFIRVTIEGWNKGVSILHFLGGSSIDVNGSRAISQTKMTISQRGMVEDVLEGEIQGAEVLHRKVLRLDSGDDLAVAHAVLDLMAGWARNHIAVHDKAAAPALAKAGG